MKSYSALAFVLLSCLTGQLQAQSTLTNEDVPRLVREGLSEEFILNLIDKQGSKLSGDVMDLVALKSDGVGERIIAAIARKDSPKAPLTSYGLIHLATAQFSDGFLLELVERRQPEFAASAATLVELKRAGLSESVIARVVRRNLTPQPMSGDAIKQLVRAGFSENFILDLLSWQPVRFSGDASRIVELRQAGVSEKILAAMIAKTNRKLPPGTEITIRLIDSIDSEKNEAGNEFRASLAEPIRLGDTEVVPRGADARVRLVNEKESGKLTGRTELSVQLLSLTVEGNTVPINTASVKEGSSSRGARTAKSAAAVGAVGAIIGAIAGGGKGAAIGAGAGAAAGAGSQVFMHGQQVRIPSETVLTFTTQETVNLP